MSSPDLVAEVPSFRTRYSDTFVTTNGTYVAKVYPAPVNYRAADGSWQPIDDRLVAGSSGGFVNHADSYGLQLPSSLSSPVRFSAGGDSVSMQLGGAAGTAVVSGQTATYQNALPGVDVAYTASAGGVRESFTLAGPSVAPIKAFLGLSAGLHAVEHAGTVSIEGPGGDVRFVLPSPVMFEASAVSSASAPPSDLGSVGVAMASVPGGVELTYTPDQQWLGATGRQFPVVLDPSVSAAVAADCSIESNNPTSDSLCGNGGAFGNVDYVGTGNSNDQLRTLLDFSGVFGALPADSQILGSRLYVNVSTVSGSGVAVGAFAMTREWIHNAASWDYYDTPNGLAWSNPQGGGDFSSTVWAQKTISTTGQAYFDITPLTQSWVDGSYSGSTVPSLMLAQDYPNQSILLLSDHNSGASGPYLEITYVPRMGDAPAATIDRTSLTDRMTLGVDVANGNALVDNNDLQIQGTGLSERVERTYNNLSSLPGSFGSGWGTAYGSVPYLSGAAGDALYLVTPDGGTSVWDVDPSTPGAYIIPAGLDATLCSTSMTGCTSFPGAQWQLTFRDGEKWEFSFNGPVEKLIADVDRNGNAIGYGYDTQSGNLSTITDTHGRTTGFSYSGNLVSKVTDNAGGRSTVYGQDANGRLTSYTDAAGNQIAYSYDTSGNLTQIQVNDPTGKAVEITKLAYTDSTHPNSVTALTRVTNLTTGAGNTTAYAYYGHAGPPPGSGLPTCPGPSGSIPIYGETVVTDPRGHTTAYCYDTHDRVYQTINNVGGVTTTTYGLDDNPETTTLPSTATFTNSYDTDSSSTGCSRPTGTVDPASATGQTPATTGVGYPDPNGPCTAVADYFPTTTTDAQQNTLTYHYDQGNENLTSITVNGLPPGANTVESENYTPSNQCIGLGTSCYWLPAWTEDGDGDKTSYGYYTSGNNAGDLQTVTPPSPLHSVSYAYDADSRVHTESDANGTTTYTYDALDRVTEEDYPDGSKTNYTYDATGNLIKLVDAGTTSTYTYDPIGRLKQETLPNTTNTYTYDATDNLKTVADGGGTVTYGYDTLNRLVSAQEPGVATPITFTYNPDSERVCTQYPNGITVKNTYEPSGALLTIKSLTGTACGQSGGTVLTSYVYTYTVGTTDTDLRQQLTINSGSPFVYHYDNLDRLTEVANSGQAHYPLYYQYDLAGNLLSKMNPDGTTNTYGHNAANEINNTGYAYDANGNLTSRPDSGGTTSLGYNQRNQTTTINPDQQGAQNLTYLTDGQDQPLQVGGPSGGSGTPQVTDSALGISSQTTSNGTYYYTRDPSGQLLSERTSTGNYYYVEDANWSVTALTNNSGGVANTYTYDPWGTTTSSAGSAPNSFGFDEGFQMPGGLYHFGDRYYDPSAGSWTQQDPVSQPTDPTAADLYTFAGDDPVNAEDTAGTFFNIFAFAECVARRLHGHPGLKHCVEPCVNCVFSIANHAAGLGGVDYHQCAKCVACAGSRRHLRDLGKIIHRCWSEAGGSGRPPNPEEPEEACGG